MNITQSRSRIAAGALLALVATAASAQTPLAAIKLDNFGYRPGDAKVAIFTANPGATVQIRDAATSAVVFTVPTNGGSIVAKGTDGTGSFDTVWWVDFSPFAAVGQYRLFSTTLGGGSNDFVVRGDAHAPVFRAALKSYYRQRCNTPKLAVHAGAWPDPAACHMGDLATTHEVGHQDHGPLDLTGGWHDAGDYNKYVWGDSGAAILFLLRAYERDPAAFGDDTGIPESGNGIPDVLDEAKWELDWFLKMQLPDGSVLSRMHVPNFESDSPPSADVTPRFYHDPDDESDAVLVAACAVGARVFAQAGHTGYAARLQAAALDTWPRVAAQANNDFKVWAAAEMFRLDPATAGARAIVDTYRPSSWAGWFLNVMNFDTQAAMTYIEAPGATPAVVANMRADVSDQVDYIFSVDDLYRNGMPDWSYYWGSNSIRAGYGVFLVEAARLGQTGTHTASEARAHALDLFHFFHGQNAMRMVYLSNMSALGGEHSVWQFYHAWFGDSWSPYSRANHIGKPASLSEPGYPYFAGTDNNGVSDNNVSALGPAPGILVGGPNKDYGGDAIPPLGCAPLGLNRCYRDWAEQRFGNPNTWEITENSIKYEAPYVSLAAAFVAQALPTGLRVDPVAGPSSDGNLVFEPGETVTMAPAWRNHRFVASTVAGAASGFTGPGPATYTIADPAASYGTLPARTTGDCLATGDCYRLSVSGSRPATHWDASVRETLASGEARDWVLHIGDSFADVPRSNSFYRFVETMLHQRVTGGCNATDYCPQNGTTREQMAVFVLVAKEGDGYVPPACTVPVFNDVPASSPFCRWVEELARRNVVSGCGGGGFCPGAPVTREQLAVFVLATREGTGWAPAACAAAPFSDVPVSSPFCRWVQELVSRGVVSGCGGGNYCPSAPVTREQMSVFLSLVFGFTLYGP